MKKSLKIIVSLMCVLVLTLSPLNVNVAKANSGLTYQTITENSRSFAYLPDPLRLDRGQDAVLIDAYTFDYWKVPAGDDFYFYVNLAYRTNFELVMIYDGEIHTYNVNDDMTFFVKIPASSQDKSIYIALQPDYNSTVYINGWGASWQ